MHELTKPVLRWAIARVAIVAGTNWLAIYRDETRLLAVRGADAIIKAHNLFRTIAAAHAQGKGESKAELFGTHTVRLDNREHVKSGFVYVAIGSNLLQGRIELLLPVTTVCDVARWLTMQCDPLSERCPEWEGDSTAKPGWVGSRLSLELCSESALTIFFGPEESEQLPRRLLAAARGELGDGDLLLRDIHYESEGGARCALICDGIRVELARTTLFQLAVRVDSLVAYSKGLAA